MAPMEWLVARMLERACAHARTESTRAAELMRAMAGKRLAIRVLGTPWAVDPILIESDGNTLAPIGAPLALLALAGTDPQAPIRRGDVRIEGDGQLAQQYRELAALLVPDLEDSLARLMGRSAAHLATRA